MYISQICQYIKTAATRRTSIALKIMLKFILVKMTKEHAECG